MKQIPSFAVIAAVKVLDLSLSNRCCNQCIFCGDVLGDLPVLTTRQIMRKLDESRHQGYDGLEISSKEFTLRADAVKIFQHARGLGFHMIHLVTNGQVFANDGKAALFLDSGINKLTISLHSDSSEAEAAITRNPASFKNKVAAIANVLRLMEEKKAACQFSINTVMTPLTAARLDHIMDFVADQGVQRHNLYFPRIQGYMSDAFDLIVPHFADIADPLSKGLDRGRTRGINHSVIDVPPCVLPRHARAVCPRLNKDVFQASNEGSERNIYCDVRREKMKGEPCRVCPWSDGCEGVFRGYVERRGWREFMPPTSQASSGAKLPTKARALVLIPWHIGDRGDVTLNTLRAARRLRVFFAEDADEACSQMSEILRLDCSDKEFLTIPIRRDEGFLKRVFEVLRREDAGVISSGGAPCFSDPGGWLVREVRSRGVEITPLAGASALTTLLSLSGYDWMLEPKTKSFRFIFFVAADVERLRDALLRKDEPVVVFLNKSSIEECLRSVAKLDADRSISLFFDMTKVPKSKFPYANEVRTLPAGSWMKALRRIHWKSVSDVALLIHPEGTER
ncbi:MAG: hypothetical protein A2X40_04015 [Elusimicrobia bacterium GWC2_65_9]|nr:MAG: hypothetical protein A2X37_05070 [Elusimicrobia bacterium GWA2_66_18]OGR76923.1 MAG: hypothetical protein A2X40_04015 [Elusimicrobia bacterium GWC2_65_9]